MINALRKVAQEVEQFIRGKPHQIRLAITCLLTEGHLLIKELPGVASHRLQSVLDVQTSDRDKLSCELIEAVAIP